MPVTIRKEAVIMFPSLTSMQELPGLRKRLKTGEASASIPWNYIEEVGDT